MKQKPTKKCEHGVQLRPASIEEAGLFYSELDETQDEALGTVGHVRMDFGSGGKEFWHTWWPHNEDRFNTLEFKEELQVIVDTLRANGPLKDLASMSNYCYKNGGAITEDSRSFGYVAETDHYRYCLRCTPTPGDYQGYLTAKVNSCSTASVNFWMTESHIGTVRSSTMYVNKPKGRSTKEPLNRTTLCCLSAKNLRILRSPMHE